MDLKSMLNDSAAQRPPSLHTPHSSYDSRAESKVVHDSHTRSQSHSQTGRPLPYPPPLQPVDSRHSAGPYFGHPSPHPNHLNSASTHASTPGGGSQSAYARSPGGQSAPYTPRDSVGPPGAYNNHSFVPSPSVSITQPLTPGSAYPHQNHTPHSIQSQPGHPLGYGPTQSPRGVSLPNGQPRQISPTTPHAYSQSATPLGPPINYNKASPQAQRPPSQGFEQHYRQSSYGSVGSAHGKDYNLGPHQPPLSEQRQSIPDIERVKERDRSVSISPKTIPQPSPYRQASVSSAAGSQGRPSIQSPSETRAMSNFSDVQTGGNSVSYDIKLEHQETPTPRSSAIPGEQPQSMSRGTSVKQENVDAVSSPAAHPNLKRNASFMSDHSHTSQVQPRKRLKREKVPIFARSARSKPLRLGVGATGGGGGQKSRPNKQGGQAPKQAPSISQQPAQAPVQHASQQQPPKQPSEPLPQQSAPSQPAKTGHANIQNGKPPPPTSGKPPSVGFKGEESIANILPYEDLTRRVCDWIYATIGSAVPPSGGAMFEIEAKIGEIFEYERGSRLSLPVETETVFNKHKHSEKTKFESSMNMEQHMLLNKYLNELTREAFLQAQKGERAEILYDHPYEIDEFFELTQEGKQNLNPSILAYLGHHQKPRVRRTRDRNSGQVKAQIIKTRIGDMEIYNPNTDFDCRVSISIESPWDGNPAWLIPMGEGSQARQKDRMSYRHMAYQIDLTQVSHESQAHMEHELEVEISTEQIRQELDNLQNGRPSKYEDLVRGLIDNVRLLCRKGSVGGPRRG